MAEVSVLMWERILELRQKNYENRRAVRGVRKLMFDECHLAHRIPQSKHNLKTYGKEVIHHELNLACVCSLRCNSRVLRNLATHPVEGKELIERIREELC